MNKIWLCLCVLILMAGCRGAREARPVRIKKMKSSELIERVQQQAYSQEWFSAKASGKYKSPKESHSFKATIRIKKDSIIWVSISPGLGIELFRMMIVKDTISFVDKLNKKYFRGGFDYLSDRLQMKLDFASLQASLLGSSLFALDEKPFYASVEEAHYQLSSLKRKELKKAEAGSSIPEEMLEKLLIHPADFHIREQRLKDYQTKRSLEVHYSEFEQHGGLLFPKKIELLATSEKPVQLSLKLSKIKTTEALRFPFRIPESYERIR